MVPKACSSPLAKCLFSSPEAEYGGGDKEPLMLAGCNDQASPNSTEGSSTEEDIKTADSIQRKKHPAPNEWVDKIIKNDKVQKLLKTEMMREEQQRNREENAIENEKYQQFTHEGNERKVVLSQQECEKKCEFFNILKIR
ncbi:hypothetical protein CHUAL_001645 [Chamberlinius hualienensis]